MTPRQHQLLRFLQGYLAEHDGVAPSFVEMAKALDLRSKSGVHRLIDSLEEQGFITRGRARARQIALVPGKLLPAQPPPAPDPLARLTDEALLAECARRGLLKVAG